MSGNDSTLQGLLIEPHEALAPRGGPEGGTAQPASRGPGGRAQGDAGQKLKFGANHGFQTELRRRVDEYFQRTGRRQRDCPGMYLKTAIIFAWLIASYVLLLFAASAWWQCLPLALSLGLAMGAVGFNVQHDGGHHAYSRHEWVNRLAARTLDMMGGSSYIWRWKHGVFHHTGVNVTGHDTDIDLGPLARLTPHQKRRTFHRWQH